MSNDAERVKRMVEKDSFGAVNSVMHVVQSDIASVLGEFMNVKSFHTDIKCVNGDYVINIQAVTDRFYKIGNTTG